MRISERHLELYAREHLNKKGVAVRRQVPCNVSEFSEYHSRSRTLRGRCDLLVEGEQVWEVKRGYLSLELLELALIQARCYADSLGVERIGVICNGVDPRCSDPQTFDVWVIPEQSVWDWWRLSNPPDIEEWDNLVRQYQMLMRRGAPLRNIKDQMDEWQEYAAEFREVVDRLFPHN